MHRAVFLDRDGVINRAVLRDGRPYPPSSLEVLEILPGVEETLVNFRSAGLKVVVVTNQPDVGRGEQKRKTVEAMHQSLRERLAIDCIKVCYDPNEAGSRRYKPNPGMLLEAAREMNIDLGRSFMVGDRWRDIGAGQAVGCRTFFIDYGYAERPPANPDHVVGNLSEAGRIILERVRTNK